MNFERIQNNSEDTEKSVSEEIAEKQQRINSILAFGDVSAPDRQLIAKLKEEIVDLESSKESDQEDLEMVDSGVDIESVDTQAARSVFKEDPKLNSYYELAKRQIAKETGRNAVSRKEAIGRAINLVMESGDNELVESIRDFLVFKEEYVDTKEIEVEDKHPLEEAPGEGPFRNLSTQQIIYIRDRIDENSRLSEYYNAIKNKLMKESGLSSINRRHILNELHSLLSSTEVEKESFKDYQKIIIDAQ